MTTINNWLLTDDGRDNKSQFDNGKRLLIGNGYLAKRGTPEEASPLRGPALILSGLYDKHANKWREPVNAPDPLYTRILYEGKTLGLESANLVSHCQSLDFRYGIYSRESQWKLAKGRLLKLKTERFASMDEPHLLCMKYSVYIDKSEPAIHIKSSVNPKVRDLNGPHLGNFKICTYYTGNIKTQSLTCETLEKKIPLAVLSMAEPMGEQLGFFIYGAVYTGLDTDEPLGAAQATASRAQAAGWDALLARHKARWDAIWDAGDVLIEGDDYAQALMRYSLYHLQIIAPRHKTKAGALSIPARGLSGQTYKGAVFWDTEMFVAPYFLATEPALAKQFIRYRIESLPGARRKAAEYGYKGAFFAWESQENGEEACTDFNVTDVFTKRPVRTYFRDKQLHISADVVYFVKKYFDSTGDFALLKEGALQLVLEVARFYLSLIYYAPERQRYEVLDVVGPDEYHERVNNNAFTNRMVAMVFESALEYMRLFKEKDPVFLQELLNSAEFEKIEEKIKQVLQGLYVPQPNAEGLIEQFDGYFKLEDCSIEAVRARLKDPREYWGGGTGVASSTRVIKQADVVTMLVLFPNDYSQEVKRANLAFYEPYTEHGSSLSACMYALLFCETGNVEQAYHFFIKSAEIDYVCAGKEYAGLIHIGGTHPAANGGAWRAVVEGFCGFSMKNGAIQLQPRLPEHWKSVRFKVLLPEGLHEVVVGGSSSTNCTN